MKKQNIFLILLLSVVFLISGCSENLSEKETKEIYDITSESVELYVDKLIGQAIENTKGIHLEKIIAQEDTLLLKRDTYLKPIANISADVIVSIDGDSLKEKEESFNKFIDEISKITAQEKENNATMRMTSLNIFDSEKNFLDQAEYAQVDEEINKLTIKQDAKLDDLDKKLYEIGIKNINKHFEKVEGGDPTKDDYYISRLGIRDGRLVLEARIYTRIDGDNMSEDEEFIEYNKTLEQISKDILSDIKANKDIMAILKDYNVEDLTLIYDSPNYSGHPWKIEEPLVNDLKI